VAGRRQRRPAFPGPVPPGELLGKYVIRRLIAIVFILIGVTVITFAVTRLVPADPAVRFLGEKGATNPAIVAAFKARWGLDKPLYVQYLVYMKNLLHGDMGTSLTTHQRVLQIGRAHV
jgi:peptide/nickel transport system permease protein